MRIVFLVEALFAGFSVAMATGNNWAMIAALAAIIALAVPVMSCFAELQKIRRILEGQTRQP